MNGLSNLHAIGDFFSKEVGEAPEHIASFYVPSNMNDITHEDVRQIVAASARTSEWVEQYLMPHLAETDEKIKELEDSCEDLKIGMEKFERKYSSFFYLRDGLYFIFDSLFALVVNAKTNAIMFAVFFKERLWVTSIYGMPTHVKNAAYKVSDYALKYFSLRD